MTGRPVVSIVRGAIPEAAVGAVEQRYAAGLEAGLPPSILTTYLLVGAGGSIAIVTIWRGQAALDAMLASGDEPFARRLIREAGGTPSAEFFDLAASRQGGR